VGQILGGESIPTLTATFSRIMCVSTGLDVSHAPSVKQSFMIFRRGRGRGLDCNHDFGERGSYEGGHGSYGVTSRVALIRVLTM